MINPHHVTAIKSDGITAPYILGVQLGDCDVLNDDVASASNAQTTTFEDTRRTRADQGLVRSDDDGIEAGFIISDRGSRSRCLVIGAPVVLVDC